MPTDLPNLLTLARIAAIPLLVALALRGTAAGDLAACGLFALAGLTDWLDGALARARRQTSDLGRMLDPIADKLLVGATLMVLAGTARLGPWPLAAAIAVLLREILVSGLREYLAGLPAGRAVVLPVTRLAKWKTGAQMAALGALLAGDRGAALLGLGAVPLDAIGVALLFAAALLTLWTGWGYMAVAWRHATLAATP